MDYFSDMQSSIIADIIGASYSVEMLIDANDFDFINQIYDLSLLLDKRLNLCMLIAHKEDGTNSQPFRKSKIMGDISENGWKIYEKQTKFSANALIVDRESIYLFSRNDKGYLINKIQDNSIKTEILYLFQNIIENGINKQLLFEDIFSSSIKQNSEKIITISTEIWSEVIARIANDPMILTELSHRKFEELIAELLVRENMQVQLTQQTKDGGVDIFAENETIFGKHLYLVECKHYDKNNKVGVSIVRSLYGIVEDKNATKGIIVTTSDFTRGVKLFSDLHNNRMNLINYDSLVNWLEKIRGNK